MIKEEKMNKYNMNTDNTSTSALLQEIYTFLLHQAHVEINYLAFF